MGVFETTVDSTGRKPDSLTRVLERRRKPRAPTLRATHTAMTSHMWELELVPAMGLGRLLGDIEALSQRSLENNVFYEAEVLAAAWPRLTSLFAPGGCWMACLWETIGEHRHLRLFMPLQIDRVGIPRRTIVKPVSNSYMPIGTPLMDSSCAGEAAEVLLRLLADPVLGLPGVVDFSHQRQDGPVFAVLRDAAQSLGLTHRVNNTFQRAALLARDKPDEFLETMLPGKRRRELGRQRRKIEADGALSFTSARNTDELLDAFEIFMTLELKGWKGRQGTALYNHKKIASFSRQIVAELAARKGCEIFLAHHEIDGQKRPVAALILLGKRGDLVPWKMAFDETQSAASPGMQLMWEATQTLLRRPAFSLADSLAGPDHFMMNNLWPDRLKIADMTVALTTDSNANLRAVTSSKARYRALKTRAKTLLKFLSRIRPFK